MPQVFSNNQAESSVAGHPLNPPPTLPSPHVPSPHAPPPHDPDDFRRRGRQIVDRIADYMEQLDSSPAATPPPPVLAALAPGDLLRALPDHAPELGDSWDSILADFDRLIMPAVTHWQSPNFFAYFPANASGPAILGELLAAGLGVNGFLWQTCPAITELETRVLDWLADLIGLPESFTSRNGAGGGVIQGTASEAALVALIAARHRADPDALNPGLTAYTSTQAHSSITKAAIIAGLPRSALRLVPVDAHLAMRPDALADMIRSDRAAGLIPFFVAATVGTTSTGAVDPLAPIGELCAREQLWLHVDAAYAGAALVCPEQRHLIAGVHNAHSFNFNPHKWLLTNFDCSALWVRDRAALTAALSVTPEYLRNPASDARAVIDYRDWQIPLGRRFRALKLWFVLRHYGSAGLQAHIREHIRIAQIFESLLAQNHRFELVAPRLLSLVCFRLKSGDTTTRALMDRVNHSGKLFLTHSVAPVGPDATDRLFLRMAIGATHTREEHVRGAWRILAHAAGEAERDSAL